MTIPGRIRQVSRLGGVVFIRPAEARNLHRLLRTHGRSTLDLRVPWLPFAVIDFLDTVVNLNSTVFEYGGGGSTAWFADHAAQVTTVENDDDWYRMLESAMRKADNATILHRYASPGAADYAASIDKYDDELFDVVLVDGRQRIACVEHSMAKLKFGGVLILDDSDRPKYADAYSLLEDWPRQEIFGFVPCKDRPGRTTLWTKPADQGQSYLLSS
jgi:predicted O-methyltransferase YrrM